MSHSKLRLNTGDILKTFDDSHPNKHSLNLAFQSLEKRSRFSQIFFHEFNNCLTDGKLPLERGGVQFTGAGHLFPNRTYYEAYIYAFMQNLHAAFDALPFIAFMMLGPMSYEKKGKKNKIDARSCGWSKNFLSAVAETFPNEKRISQLLNDFASNENFLILQAVVNRSKHQSLVRILNDGESVVFEEVEYFTQFPTGPKKILELNVRNFMQDCSKVLFPALFEIVYELQETRIRLGRCA